MIKCITAVLALIKIPQIQIPTAKAHIAPGIEIIVGYRDSRIVYGHMCAASHVFIVGLDHSDPIQEHQLDSMLPIDDAQR